jgi:hypothetical protein
MTYPRLFALYRKHDPTGISGTGIVATGVEWGNGRCAIQWQTAIQSVAIYDSVDDIAKIHGHNGDTEIIYQGDAYG